MTLQLLSSDVTDHRFTASDVRFLHRSWLQGIYPWAGEYRGVNVSKGGFTFAVASFIPALMDTFEHGPLAKYSPCRFSDLLSVAEALAVTHCELILIHPFREGNGRCARLLSQAMAMQAGYAGLDFAPMAQDTGDQYILAIQASLDRNYEPMTGLFRETLERSA